MRQSSDTSALHNVVSSARVIARSLVAPAGLVVAGFVVMFALSTQSSQPNANTTESQVNDVTANESSEATLSEEAQSLTSDTDNDDTNDSEPTEESTGTSNSFKIEISSSSSSSASEGSYSGGAESQPQVVINGEAYELPRNGRVKERVKEETDTTESDTRIDVDIDGGENTTIRISDN